MPYGSIGYTYHQLKRGGGGGEYIRVGEDPGNIALIIIIIMKKNFNGRSSHDHHGSNRRELAQQEHPRGSHSFTHTLTST